MAVIGSSSIWWTASTSSFTSSSGGAAVTPQDPPAPVQANPASPWVVRARLVHPFPSVLDGIVVAVVSLVAGAAFPLALQLGLSVMLLQFAIGAGNDVMDVARDAGRAGKAIPSGLVSLQAGRAIAGICAALGLALALSVSPLALVVAIAGLGIGIAYDLRARGTPFSWVPMAVGVPMLPVYGWLGATGTLPPVFMIIVPLAAAAGAALAIANAVVDVERDAEAGASSIAAVLGVVRASEVALLLQLVVAAVALASGAVLATPMGWQIAVAASALVPIGGALFGAFAVARGHGIADRELAWEAQAVGLGLLAVAWVSGLGASMGAGLGS